MLLRGKPWDFYPSQLPTPVVEGNPAALRGTERSAPTTTTKGIHSTTMIYPSSFILQTGLLQEPLPFVSWGQGFASFCILWCVVHVAYPGVITANSGDPTCPCFLSCHTTFVSFSLSHTSSSLDSQTSQQAKGPGPTSDKPIHGPGLLRDPDAFYA